MNSTASSRRFVGLFASLALGSLSAFTLAFAMAAPVLPLFAGATAALTVLIAARDYAARPAFVARADGPALAARRHERMPLAA